MHLEFDTADLEPVIQRVAERVIERVETERAQLGGKLCYSETEAAHLLGVEPHVLGDERRRGRITASQIVGRRIRYTQADLTRYLEGRRYESK